MTMFDISQSQTKSSKRLVGNVASEHNFLVKKYIKQQQMKVNRMSIKYFCKCLKVINTISYN